MGRSAWAVVMGGLLVGGCVAAPAEPTLGPPVSPADLIDIDNYRRLMDDALYTRLGDDRGYGPEHDLARDNIEDEMVAAGLDVELEAFEHGGDTWFNVVGSRVGTSRPDEVIVVGAHFDSVDNPGADDNATGTALVLELARALGSIELAPTVRFVAFDREEQGKFGSAAFAEDHAAEIVSVLTADMVGQDHGARGAMRAARKTRCAQRASLAKRPVHKAHCAQSAPRAHGVWYLESSQRLYALG